MESTRQRIALCWFGYILITFILGFMWHLVLFAKVYQELGVYSNLDHPNFALGILSMVIQGGVLALLFPQFLRGSNPLHEAMRFSLTMGLFFGSGSVIAEVAKQSTTSLSMWFLVAGGFTVIHFTLIGLLFGLVYSQRH